ncbi:hypothetical protein G9A89_014816 [Geosiphon pyriformis]|nr:hypothetical protein G9A89_014816 [Geosiphon pyriformis]
MDGLLSNPLDVEGPILHNHISGTYRISDFPSHKISEKPLTPDNRKSHLCPSGTSAGSAGFVAQRAALNDKEPKKSLSRH